VLVSIVISSQNIYAKAEPINGYKSENGMGKIKHGIDRLLNQAHWVFSYC